MDSTRISLSEAAKRISDETGVDRAAVTTSIRGLMDLVIEATAEGTDVDLGREYGVFTGVERKPRRHVLPSGDEVMSEGGRRLTFKAAAPAKRRVK